MPRKTRILLLAALPAVLAGTMAMWLLFPSHRAGAATLGLHTEVIEVETVMVQESISISGNIEPINSADMAFPIAGYIDEIYVNKGDMVSSGTLLARLEDSRQRYNLAAVDVDIDTMSLTGTRRDVELLELEREMTRESLENTELTSTISGLVTSVYTDPGDYVTALTAGASADTVVRIIDRSSMIATVEVDELDAPYLRMGQEVAFEFDAYPEMDIVGEIHSVPLEADATSQGIAVLETEVIIKDPPEEILPWFTFSGEILLDSDVSIMLVPENAVITTDSDNSYVMIAVDETDAASLSEKPEDFPDINLEMPAGQAAIPVQVTIDEYGDGKVQVLRGLDENNKIVIQMNGTGSVIPIDGTGGVGSANVLEMLGMSMQNDPPPDDGPAPPKPGEGGGGGDAPPPPK